MGFVITFPSSAMRQRMATKSGPRPATAQIMIFPGVRYERPAQAARPRDKDKPGSRFFDPTPQPG
ncbi:hypothetical protein ACTJJ7_27965 [Phyllobacterium sp. 22229]|nr:hypothetical protein [Phyllobacterium myrsinacearum]